MFRDFGIILICDHAISWLVPLTSKFIRYYSSPGIPVHEFLKYHNSDNNSYPFPQIVAQQTMQNDSLMDKNTTPSSE